MKVPPSRSAICRARVARLLDELAAAHARPRSSDSRSTERMTGTTSPCGAATAIPMFADGNRSSASPANWTFTSGWRMSALRADLREQVGDGDAHVGVELARALDQRVRLRHLDRDGELEDRHLPGLGEPAGDRAADVRERNRLDLVGHGAGAAARRRGRRGAARRPAAPRAARSTSSATMRPSGPVPVSPASSTPRSRAIRRASGEALTRSRRRRSRRGAVDRRARQRRLRRCRLGGGRARAVAGADVRRRRSAAVTDSPGSPITRDRLARPAPRPRRPRS